MQPPELATLRSRYLAAQLSGERREALRLLIDDGVKQGAGIDVLRRDVIAAAQREIGTLWQENRISVADEHTATAIAHLALAHLYQHAPQTRRRGKRVMVACVEGEQHDFPARLVTDALDLAGYDVHYLGANVPTDHLIKTMWSRPPDLLALSVTMSFNVASARAARDRVRAEMPNLKVALGGGAFTFSAELQAQLKSSLTAPDSESFVTATHQLWGKAA
ncbi:MAG: cobalamin-dependent protein [Archangiaceae bacterium]|nr:cobalamin-dependent protein [Archangiaceae bacterium]